METDRMVRSFSSAHAASLTRFGAAMLVLLTLAGRSTAGDPSADGSEPSFSALMIDGRTATGRIVSFGEATITIAPQDAKKEELRLDRLVKLTRELPVAIAGGENAQVVLLGDGDRLLRASIGAATDTALEVRSELLGKLEVPLDGVLGMILAGSGQGGGIDALRDRIEAEPRKAEVVWLNNGDRIDGSFLGMDERSIKLEVDRKTLEVDRGTAVAVGFDPKLLRYPRPKGAFLEATLSDGTRLGLATVKLAEGNIEATTRFGRPVRFPLTELARLHARSSSVVYLTEREPPRAGYESYVGPSRPYRLDRAVDGQPIRLGGQTYDRGIGMQSRTLLAYPIQPGDRRFQALVGVDERAGPLGNVVLRVFVDRQERFKSPPMTDRDPPLPLDIDLAGGKILILATEFGERGNVRDLADWAEARIIR
jgi:NPCBM/NEW2 domain